MKEIWKDVLLYEGLYKINDAGIVKSLGNNKTRKEKILKPENLNGYLRIRLYKMGIVRKYYIHRLVGQAFLGLDVSNKKTLVCHKDDNPLNNHKDNLFLGTHKDNSQDMKKKRRHSKYWYGKYGNKNPNAKGVNQYNLDGTFIKSWESMADANRKLNILVNSISSCCSGRIKTAGGFIWKYNN